MIIKKALVSVWDKTNLELLIPKLVENNIEIISTGGTAKKIKELGYDYTPIEDITGNPESFSGRMKTISFQVESALLFRRDDQQDINDAKNLKIDAIDLVVCNLYPFSKTYTQNLDQDEMVELIDIGGPTMIRAASKNFKYVTTLTDPNQYSEFIKELTDNNGSTGLNKRMKWAQRSFEMSACYDQMIATKLNEKLLNNTFNTGVYNTLDKINLRYGENPHQEAYLIKDENNRQGIPYANQIGGKDLSYNNILDADAAWKSLSDIMDSNNNTNLHGVVIVKHLNPTGAALCKDNISALELAWNADNVSAFGSIVALSGTITKDVANFFDKKFIEVLIAPHIDDDAKTILSKKKNLRILICDLKNYTNKEVVSRSVCGGILIQQEDEKCDPEHICVTKKSFNKNSHDLINFGTMAGKNIKSNAITLVHQNSNGDMYILSQGCGQPNRIDALKKLAVKKAKQFYPDVPLCESILISDAFFPFADSIELSNDLDIKMIIQPGGSIRDQEVIDACNKYNITMAFTNRRHFRH